MDLVTRSFDFTEPFHSSARCAYFSGSSRESSSDYSLRSLNYSPRCLDDENLQAVNISDLESGLIKSLAQDDKSRFASHSVPLFRTDFKSDRSRALKLLRLCCALDAVECAAVLLNGELGSVPVINDVDPTAGMTALHTAAEAHSGRCVELLLKRRARTDLRTRDGRALLPLELSLSSSRLDVIWNPDEYSVEDLVVMLSEKDLTTVKHLSEKTKELDAVAYASAMRGKIEALAALLIVAADTVNKSIIVLHDADSGSKEKATVYECVIGEALALGRDKSPLRSAKRTCTPTKSESDEKRKILLREIELLHLFGAVALNDSTEKKPTPPLILAIKARDETIIELLLKRNVNVRDVDDAEGNSALHWCLRTSWGSSSQQIKILMLLLSHGAPANQKNKLESTAFHLAAGNGNLQALQILLLNDPDGINYKTIKMETPLFFAVKNDHIDCAELLLRWGANSEVLNLRRERPIDLAKSQDMRFMLNQTNISLRNRPSPEQNFSPSFLADEVILETYQALLNRTDEGTPVERNCSNFKTEICKYFESPYGCIRGAKCFFAHGEEDLKPVKQGMHVALARRIFVGGLPLSLDSDTLHKILEQLFGLVEDAFVVSVQTRDDQTQSRGFGFVNFKHEKSAQEAIQAHYITIMGKQVEIKSAVEKCNLQTQQQNQSPRQQELEQNIQHKLQMETAREKNVDKMLILKKSEEAESEKISWLSRLVSGKPKAPSPESEVSGSPKSKNQKIPIWLKTFKKWFPSFLLAKHKKDGQYSLSSLKADFRAIFGLELDHASVGYIKLSDFMRSFSGICRMKEVSFGNGFANHLVLVPVLSTKPSKRLLQPIMHCKPTAASLDEDTADSDSSRDIQDLSDPREVVSIKSNGSICLQDLSDPCENVSIESNGSKCFQDLLEPFDNVSIRSYSNKEANTQHDVLDSENISAIKDVLPNKSPEILQFSDPFMLLNTQPSASKCYIGAEGMKAKAGATEGSRMNQKELRNQNSHMVLEALSRKRNNTSLFFLREYDFYDNYEASIMQGKCFWCNQPKMLLWSNFPCQHRLWCTDCKLLAARAAGNFEHKCVVCDRLVERFIFIPTNRYSQPVHGDAPNQKESPPLNPSPIQMPSNNPFVRNSSPSIEEMNWKIQSEKADYSSSMWRISCTN